MNWRFSRQSNFELTIRTRKGIDENVVYRNVFDFCEEILTAIVFALDASVSLSNIQMKKVMPKEEDVENYVLVDNMYDVAEEWSPYIHFQKRGNLVLRGGMSRPLRSFKQNETEKIQNYIDLFKDASDLVLEAVDFYKRGIKLKNYWENESFLCFYKVIELFINKEYATKYKGFKMNKIEKEFTILMNKCNSYICDEDIRKTLKDFLSLEKVSSNKDLFRFICETTDFPNFERDEEIVLRLTSLRASIAHPFKMMKKSSKKENEPNYKVSQAQLRVCSNLAKHLIMLHLHKNS